MKEKVFLFVEKNNYKSLLVLSFFLFFFVLFVEYSPESFTLKIDSFYPPSFLILTQSSHLQFIPQHLLKRMLMHY